MKGRSLNLLCKKGSEKRRQSLTKQSSKDRTRPTCTDAVINQHSLMNQRGIGLQGTYRPFTGIGHMSVYILFAMGLGRKRCSTKGLTGEL